MVNSVSEVLDEKEIIREAKIWRMEFLRKYKLKNPSAKFKAQLLQQGISLRCKYHHEPGNLLIKYYEKELKDGPEKNSDGNTETV